MAIRVSSVEDDGPDFAQRVRVAEETVRKLEANRWDFDSAPEVFAERSQADVLGKEIAHFHDGRVMTRIGRLVMGGVGELFHLMGPIPSNASFKVGPTQHVFEDLHRQLGSEGLRELPAYRDLGTPEQVEYFNYTNFYQLRDLVFWSVLYGSGAYPSTFEHMSRHFAKGDFVQNMMYRPARKLETQDKPRVMMGNYLSYSFPSPVVEWMDKPLFGGLARDTQHVEYLLTPEPSKVSHPYLPLVGEGIVEYGSRPWHLRQFAGVTPKEGLRGPDVPPEGPRKKGGRK